jgi:DNA-binding MarR family transcriptional regulator
MDIKPPRKLPSSPHGTQAWLSSVRAYNLCEQVMGLRLAEIGLRVGDLEVLATLATNPGITQQALASRCFVTKAGVSMLLSSMEESAWVQRDSHASDARAKSLSLTPDGQALASKAMRIQAEVVASMVDGASATEIATLQRVMDRAAERLEGLRKSLKAAGA